MRIAFRLPSVRASRALTSFVAPALVATAALLVGCSDPNSPGDDTGGTGAGGGGGGDAIKLTQVNNFSATSTLTPMQVPLAPGEDIKLCWDQLTKDIQGHAVNPASDINQVTFAPARGTPDQVSGWLATGQLTSSKIADSGAFVLKPASGTTCANLSQFMATGGTTPFKPADFKPQDGVTYLVTFATGTRLGYGSRTMVYLIPTSGNTDTTLNVTNDSAKLDYKADLHDLVKPSFDATTSPTFDWSAIANDGQGIEMQGDVSNILLGFYKDKTVAQLEAGFLNLEQPTEAEGGPTRSWQLGVNRVTRANLAGAPGRANEGAFTNFSTTDTGTWLLGMFCNDCQNPAPVIVTILDPK
jgi:hypothetical protein